MIEITLLNRLKNYAKNISIFIFILVGLSCTTEEIVDENFVQNEVVNSYLSKSNNSVKLAISQVSAEVTKSGNPASNVLDGSTSTRWSGKGTSVDFFITLENESLIDYLKIAFPSGSSRVYGFVMYTSTNNSTWTKVKDNQSSGTTTSLEEIDVTNSTGKYIKIVLEGSDYNAWNYISELEVYGIPGDNTSQEDPDEEDPSEDPVISDNGVVDFGSLDVETSWISEDKGDRDTFDASDVDGKQWMDVYSTGIVMMKCLAADGHRTELKEKSGVEASLNKYKKMNYTAAVTSIPEHGVTVAQIHNRGGVNRPWIRVYIDADRYIKIKATKTTPDEDKSTYTTYTGPKYTSGNDFSITIITKNGEASFEITTGGTTSKETLTPSGDWNNYDDDFYLKAGVYTEGDDTQPQMKLSSFSLTY